LLDPSPHAALDPTRPELMFRHGWSRSAPDVLAGWLAGRWAQRQPGDEAAAAFAVACQSVAEHGAAAEPPPLGPLRAADLIERLYR
ncbi:MAG TPA: hypothetical protein VIM34_09370, partial [Burkholderiaceae bacterium]